MSGKRGRFVPYYEQVASVLRAYVLSQDTESPVHLPTERDLCRLHDASRSSIRKALEILQSEGLIRRSPKRGTLTVPPGIRAWIRLRKSRLITLICTLNSDVDLPLSFYGRIYQGIASRCQEVDCALSSRHMLGTFPRVGPDYRPEDPEHVTGVIILGVRDERVVAMHTYAGYPVVCVDHWTKNPKADAVVMDCFAEGQLAADFLLSQGHRHLFYVGNTHAATGGHQREVDSDLMQAGFERALRIADLPLPAGHMRFCHRSDSEEMDAIADWFAQLQPRPTAGLIYSQQGLQRFRLRLGQHGLSCPCDVSLICKGHAGQNVEGVCVLLADPENMGRMAVDLLLERAAEKRTLPVVQAIRPTLQRGQTVRCIPV